MSDEPDMTQRPGWKAVERWLSENESPPPKAADAQADCEVGHPGTRRRMRGWVFTGVGGPRIRHVRRRPIWEVLDRVPDLHGTIRSSLRTRGNAHRFCVLDFGTEMTA
jgi:hypothetical protein